MEAALARQLADFLEGGVFGAQLNSNLVGILKTCPLTNWTGERLFDNFDDDLQKRRNTSLHNRSTTNMWKGNKTSKWLGKQSLSSSEKLVKKAIKCLPVWGKKHQEEGAAVKEKIKAKIRHNKSEKDKKDFKEKEKRLKVINAIIGESSNLIETKQELDQVFNGPNAVETLKDQIRFRSLIRGEKISLKGNKQMLYKRLLHHITREIDEE